MRRLACDAVIIRPPAVYGPRDRDVLAAFRLAARGIAVRTGPARQQLAMVHVTDLVRALVTAGHMAGASGLYYVNGGNYAWEDIVSAIGDAVGRRSVILPLPAPMVRASGYAARAWSRVTGAKPLLTPERSWDLVQPYWTCDDTRARGRAGLPAAGRPGRRHAGDRGVVSRAGLALTARAVFMALAVERAPAAPLPAGAPQDRSQSEADADPRQLTETRDHADVDAQGRREAQQRIRERDAALS